MITILSVPRTGTRFFGNFVMNVLGLRVRYAHFSLENISQIKEYLRDTRDVIIVPVRDHEETAKSHGPSRRQNVDEAFGVMQILEPRLRELGAHFIDIVKSESTPDQIRDFLFDASARWTCRVSEFVETWEPIGSQHIGDEKTKEITQQMLDFRLFVKKQRD